jgi:hypothetical protein
MRNFWDSAEKLLFHTNFAYLKNPKQEDGKFKKLSEQKGREKEEREM